MKENSTNNAHLHGYMNSVRTLNAGNGKKSFIINLTTEAKFKTSDGEYQTKKSYHNVNVVTDDKAIIAKMDKIAADLQTNYDNRETEGYKPITHEASFDGILATRKNTSKDGVDYYNQVVVVTNEDDMKLDCKLADNEVRNTIELKGNIAKVDVYDEFAVVQIGTHYFAPGESTDYKGEVKPYQEKTNYVETRVSGNFRKDEFEAIKNGEIAKGDLVTARGQMHNNNFQDKNGVTHRGIVVDLNKIEIVAKKSEKKTEAAKNTVEKAPKAKVATPRKKTQRSL